MTNAPASRRRRRARRSKVAGGALLGLALASAASAPRARAQELAPSAAVQGWVVDADLGEPLPGARVWVAGAEPAFTDADGFFDLGALPAGERALHVTHLGYAPLNAAVTFGGGHPRPRLALRPDSARARELASVRTRLSLDRRRGGEFVRIIERPELLELTGERLYERARGVIPFGGPCDRSPFSGRCQGVDGPLLVVDDDIGGRRMADLEQLDPRALYLVELYPDRRFAHAYTVEFIARAMAQPALLLRARRVPR
jgi:hypothetical protein